ncbi:MAG: dipeptidase [Schaedlerella sp.]|nr:dipeptidase [Schaedlerella sp.]
MGLIDMHCDTISKILHSTSGRNLLKNDLCIDIEKLKKADSSVQYFASFIFALNHEMKAQNIKEECGQEWFKGFGTSNLAEIPISEVAWDLAWEEVLCMIARLRREECDNLQIITNCCDAENYVKNKILTGLATVEEGGVLNGKIERVEELYKMGIRLLTLTWNFENCLGFPNNSCASIMNKGLKPFGIEVVEKMNELGMMIDVSHLSDGGFWDCIRYSKSPIVASHSNARALCGHPRNLTDEMLKALAEKGGVTGLNFYPAFLVEDGLVGNVDIARHALHMINVAGEDVVAIGTDFDGFDGEAESDFVTHIGEMGKIWDVFKKAGITERQIDKIWHDNAWRVMKEVIK